MKRKTLWLLALLVLSVLVYGAKYRQDHPPLSRADVRFRRMAEQADRVVISGPPLIDGGDSPVLAQLQESQIPELEAKIRLLDAPCQKSGGNPNYQLDFFGEREIFRDIQSAVVVKPSPGLLFGNSRSHPRRKCRNRPECFPNSSPFCGAPEGLLNAHHLAPEKPLNSSRL